MEDGCVCILLCPPGQVLDFPRVVTKLTGAYLLDLLPRLAAESNEMFLDIMGNTGFTSLKIDHGHKVSYCIGE